MMIKRNILLYPLSLIYGLITGFRNFLYDSGILPSKEFSIPIICVGNITVGGTGKTPHTQYIAGLLKENFNVATLSRGYKRKTQGFMIANPSSTVNEIGDEPLQIFRNYPEILVTVDKKRVSGVKRILLEHPDTEVIILDDAFQHRSITPGFSILLSDFSRPILNDHMLPYGNLRESKKNINRADIILITKSPEDLSAIQRRLTVKEWDKLDFQKLYFTSYKYDAPVHLFGDEDEETLQEFLGSEDCGIVLITGIANPVPLKEYLNKYQWEIIHLEFPDHHEYDEKDLLKISAAYSNLKSKNRFLITTEKDSVRFREFTNIAEPIKSAFYYIPIGISFLNEDKDEFDNLIIDYVRKNHRNYGVSED